MPLELDSFICIMRRLEERERERWAWRPPWAGGLAFGLAVGRIALGVAWAGLLGSAAGLPDPPAPPENPITEEKRVLGKMLFWDEQLSADSTVTCGTCHIPAAGGIDPREAVHPGSRR